jgi:hypothetical protein
MSPAAEWIRGLEAKTSRLQGRLTKLEAELEATAERLAALLDEPDAPSERSYP